MRIVILIVALTLMASCDHEARHPGHTTDSADRAPEVNHIMENNVKPEPKKKTAADTVRAMDEMRMVDTTMVMVDSTRK